MDKYILPNKYILKISDKVSYVFRENRQKKRFFHEAGGILFGKVFDDYILMNDLSIPGEGDKRGVFFFIEIKRERKK